MANTETTVIPGGTQYFSVYPEGQELFGVSNNCLWYDVILDRSGYNYTFESNFIFESSAFSVYNKGYDSKAHAVKIADLGFCDLYCYANFDENNPQYNYIVLGTLSKSKDSIFQSGYDCVTLYQPRDLGEINISFVLCEQKDLYGTQAPYSNYFQVLYRLHNRSVIHMNEEIPCIVGSSGRKVYNLRVIEDGVEYTFDDMKKKVKKQSTPSGPSDDSGDYDDYNYKFTFEEITDTNLLNSGVITMFNPSTAQLRAFEQYLWSSDFFDTITKAWSSPMDAVVSLKCIKVPCASVGSAEMKVGGVGTGVNAPVVSSQFVQINCGSVDISQYFGSVLDFNPYTNISIYLPGCGVHQLDIDNCMDGKIEVHANVDLLSGDIVYQIMCTRGYDGLQCIMYHFSGNIAYTIPLSARDSSQLVRDIMGIGTNIASGSVGGTISSIAGTVMSAKNKVQHNGNTQGNRMILDTDSVYIMLERPIPQLPSDYNNYNGMPSFITTTLSNLSGFTKVERVLNNTLICHSDEQDEIIKLLKEGVYL